MGEELVDRKNRRSTAQSHHVVAHNQTPIQWSLIAGVLIALILIARDWSVAGLGALEIECLVGLAILCLTPVFRWYRQGMKWLPLGEVFVMMHLTYYVFPCFSRRRDWLVYSESIRVEVVLAVGVFLAAFLVTYFYCLGRPGKLLTRISFLSREASSGTMWAFFSIWLALSLLVQYEMLADLGLSLNVVRPTLTATGCVSVIFLFYQLGQAKFSDGQSMYLLGGFVFGLALNFANGFLNGTAQILGAALLAFTLGRKQVPVKALAMSIVLLSLLQLGKSDYREKYWGKNENFSEQTVPLVEGYKTWFTSAWRKMQHVNEPGSDNQGILERTSLVQVLAKVMNASPNKQPFVYGATYLMLPELMVPRVFWPDKPRGTIASETLGIYYQIQTEKNANFTGVAVGQVAEAWANFGWYGLIAAGAFLGILLGVPAKLTQTLVPNQIGWLLGAIFLVYSLNLEHIIPELCASLATSLFMGIVTLAVISRVADVASERLHRTNAPVGANLSVEQFEHGAD